MIKIKNRLFLSNSKCIFLAALFIRLLFTAYGIYHDSKVSHIDLTQNVTNLLPKYTDIDYQVFSDAAQYVYEVKRTLIKFF